MIRKKKTLNVALLCFIILFSLASYKRNIYCMQLQEENVIVLICSFRVQWRLHASIIFHVRVCEPKIPICKPVGIGRVQNGMQASI